MDCTVYERDFGDFIEGRLAPARARTMELHLEACAECRALVADLETIRAASGSLGTVAPPDHLWTRISEALAREARRTPTPGLSDQPGTRSGWAAYWHPLAAAAMLVLVASGVWWIGSALERSLPGAPPTAANAGLDADVRLAERPYVATIATLEEITGAGSTVLDRDTAAVLEAHLAAVDQAIGESRAALDTEPASQLARDTLFEALRTKITLLEGTVVLMNEMRAAADGAAVESLN